MVFHESEGKPRYHKVQKGRDRHGKRPIGRADQKFNWPGERYMRKKEGTFINVGPADCIVLTRKEYHQIAPHLSPLRRFWGIPIRSIGLDIMTGTKRTKRYMKRFAVRIGSHMLSIRKVRMVERIDLCDSDGEKMEGTGEGMSFGDERGNEG